MVFGGGSGIGLATATIGADAYSAVVIADPDPCCGQLDLVRSGRVSWVSGDARKPDEVLGLLSTLIQEYGILPAVVTTVGGAHVQNPLELDLDAWRAEVEFNLNSAYVVATAAAGIMAKHGGGAIVTTSSSYATVAKADRIGYSAAKAGVIALTKSLALATARKGIRVNCVAPGATDTPRVRSMTGTAKEFEKVLEASAQGRIATPEDVAQAILYLASPAASSITGQVIWVNNGTYMP